MVPRFVPTTVFAIACLGAVVAVGAEVPDCVRELEPPPMIPPPRDEWRPRPDKARRALEQAIELAREGESRRAVTLVEEAIRLDAETNPSERPYYSLRAELLADLGDGDASESCAEYNRAMQAEDAERFQASRDGYARALNADPEFLWAANNRAWMQATHPSCDARNGRDAIPFALYACVKSDWHNWSFIDTLAASYAEAGDFSAAIRCGERALEIAPEEQRDELLEALHLYRRGWPRRPTRLGLAIPDQAEDDADEAFLLNKAAVNGRKQKRPDPVAREGRPASFVEPAARAVLAGEAAAVPTFVSWSETPQGHAFWSREFDRVKSGQPLSREARVAIEAWLEAAEE